MKYCSKCNQPLPDDAATCDKCGSRVFSHNSPAENAKSFSKYCGNCKTPLPNDVQKCPKCGATHFTFKPSSQRAAAPASLTRYCDKCGNSSYVGNRRCKFCGTYSVNATDLNADESTNETYMLFNIMHEQFEQTKKLNIISKIMIAAAAVFVISIILEIIAVIIIL